MDKPLRSVGRPDNRATLSVSGNCVVDFSALCDQRRRKDNILPLSLFVLKKGKKMSVIENWADWGNAFANEITRGCLPSCTRAYQRQVRVVVGDLVKAGFNPADESARLVLSNILAEWAEKNSHATVQKKLEMLRKFLVFLDDSLGGVISVACFRALKMPKGARRRGNPNALGIEEQAAILSLARGFQTDRNWPYMHMYTYISFGILTGLRPTELMHLDWCELDLSANPAVLGLKELPTRRLKNRLASQRLSLPPELVYLLSEYFAVKASGPIFPAVQRASGHERFFKTLREVLGNRDITPHILRRTAITNWNRQGIDLQQLSILSRHLNPVVLNRHYLARPTLADINTGFPFYDE